MAIRSLLLLFLILSVNSCRKEGEASKKEMHQMFEKLEGTWILTDYSGSYWYNDMWGSKSTEIVYNSGILTYYEIHSNPWGHTYDTIVYNPYSYTLEFYEFSRHHQQMYHKQTINEGGTITQNERVITDWKEANENDLRVLSRKIKFLNDNTLELTSSGGSSSLGASSSGTSTMVFMKI